jgi:hypothetical protein
MRNKFKFILLTVAIIGSAAAILGINLYRPDTTQPVKAAGTPYTTTITNFDPAGNQATRFDVNGNAVDAHDGDMAFFNGKYYLYGTSYDCGYKLKVAGTPFCGFKSYSSTDLANWKDEGFLFDATTAAWQASCAAPRYGCYQPHVLFNSGTNKYVLWINSYDNSSGYHVFTADEPQGPFVEETGAGIVSDSGAATGGFVNGAMDLFVDDNGTAYITYVNIQSGHTIKIQKLNESYTSGVDSAVSTGVAAAEPPILFRKADTYYLMYGPACEYCNGTSTQYRTTSNVLGAWSPPTQLNGNSCGGQPGFVSKIPGTTSDIYLYSSDLWVNGNPNQALANFFWAPLSFLGTSISPISCSGTFTFTLGEGAPGHSVFPAGADQSSGFSYYKSFCDIKSNWIRYQSFTPGQSGVLSSLYFSTYKSGDPNGNLEMSIYQTDKDSLPAGAPVYSKTFSASQIGWSPKQVAMNPNISVHGGMQYVLVLRSSGTNNGGCYGFSYNDYKPYQFGKEAYMANGGGWIIEPARSLKFQTSME